MIYHILKGICDLYMKSSLVFTISHCDIENCSLLRNEMTSSPHQKSSLVFTKSESDMKIAYSRHEKTIHLT